MVGASKAPGSDVQQVGEFSSGPRLDYVRGVKSGEWTRQIAFVKDTGPLGPNYFIISDSLRTTEPAAWRLWLTADNVTTSGQSAAVVGKEDVNTDIIFV